MNKIFVKSPSPLNRGTKNLTQTFQKSKISFYFFIKLESQPIFPSKIQGVDRYV